MFGLLVTISALTIILFTFTVGLQSYGEQQFVYLAYSFLKGHLNLVRLPPTVADLSFYQGNYFWPLGPFPSTVLLPFVALFGLSFNQAYIQFPLNILNAFLVYKIAKSTNLSKTNALLLTVFFIFGSVYTPLSIISFSWYFAQIVATTLLLLALFEYQTKNRPFVIGIILSFAILTRISLVFAAFFFIADYIRKKGIVENLLKFSLPVVLSLVLIATYNYKRFGSILEGGYKYQIVPEEAAQRRDLGIFSFTHIPANLYYMVLKGPDPVFKDNSHTLKPPFIRFDHYGNSIFLMSPILFLLFLANFKDRTVKSSLFTTILILIPLLTYYGIGFRQVGYRYALDFFPFLLIPLSSAIVKVKSYVLVILVFSGVFITWLFLLEKLSGY